MAICLSAHLPHHFEEIQEVVPEKVVGLSKLMLSKHMVGAFLYYFCADLHL